jgi:hypothetical protein
MIIQSLVCSNHCILLWAGIRCWFDGLSLLWMLKHFLEELVGFQLKLFKMPWSTMDDKANIFNETQSYKIMRYFRFTCNNHST